MLTGNRGLYASLGLARPLSKLDYINPYLELITPPVIKVPDFLLKFPLAFPISNSGDHVPPYGREDLMGIPRRN